MNQLNKEKDRVWQAYKLTGDEPKFRSEIKGIMTALDNAERAKKELQNRFELSQEAESNIDTITECCRRVKDNLGNLSFAEKRQALETLSINVRVKGDEVVVYGNLPIESNTVQQYNSLLAQLDNLEQF